MKSALELAMARFADAEEQTVQPLSWAQKDALAEIDVKYKAKIAEREVFLQKQILQARAQRDGEALRQLEHQLRSERARLEGEREQAKEAVRLQAPRLKVLVIGSGGREHALVNSCLASPLVAEVVAAPGNGGMSRVARCVDLDVADVPATVALARTEKVDFVIVGPEVPLALGLVDALGAVGVPAYGPGKAAARLESSKVFCKDFLQRHGIPTAAYATFSDLEPALAYVSACVYPVVVKASGLAAGKGVVICEDEHQARAALQAMIVDKAFGESGAEVVIEEFLRGEEASLMVVVCDDRYVCLPVSQDHKRIGEGDTGLNTGGMGAYAPAAVVDAELQQWIERHIIQPTLQGFAKDRLTFRGTLFIGLMIDGGAAKVLEFNVRFGDPECQVLLPLLASDPIQLLYDCARGCLKPDTVQLKDGFAAIVVLASGGYPGQYRQGDAIALPVALPEGVDIVHAGTRMDAKGTLLTAGGRVLGVVATADALQTALDKAYAICAQVQWPDCYYRRDIGWRQLASDNQSRGRK